MQSLRLTGIGAIGIIVLICLFKPQPLCARTDESLAVSFTDSHPAVTIPIGDSVDATALRAWLTLQPDIAVVGNNQSYIAARVPNDPLYSSQSYLAQVNVVPGWDYETGADTVVVAVLDTGVDTNHPDLAGNMWVNSDEIALNGIDDDANGYVDDSTGWNFINDSADPNPGFDVDWTESGIHHGTAIAGVIGAVGNNSVGITGLDWSTQLMPVRVLDSTGTGNTADVYNGIRYAVANGAQIINLSFVGTGTDPVLAQAIADAHAAGVLVIAAAGNDLIDLDTDPRYPVCMDHVLGVGGVDRDNQLVIFTGDGGQVTGGSNYGTHCVDLVGPAKNIYSTVVYEPTVTHSLTGITLDDYYLNGWSGTSLASPIIAGAAALLKSYNPSLTPDQLTQILQQTATRLDALNPSYSGQMGHGIINIAASIGWVLPAAHPIITAAGKGGGPQVRLFNSTGVLQSQFFAYATTFRGGVNVATGDVNGDGINEVITGVSEGAPHVRIFDSTGKSLYSFFAYATGFRGGVNVAAGDVDGDGVDEIITGAGAGGSPHVRVFDRTGKSLYSFFAYATGFRGGVNVAAGDLTGDHADEIVTGTGAGSAPHVRVFDARGRSLSSFFAYATTFRGGVHVAVGDIVSDGIQKIITAPIGNGGPHVRVFELSGTPVSQLFAFPMAFRGGVSVAAQ